MEYYKPLYGTHYLTVTYDQFYYLRRLCTMFDSVVCAEKHTRPYLTTEVHVEYLLRNFRLLLLAHATLPDELKRTEFMVELQHMLEIPFQCD